MPSRSQEYMAFVRKHVSCLSWDAPKVPLRFDEVEGYVPSVAHHVRMGGGGGTGLKPSDYRTVPLTDQEHRVLHREGEESFWRRVGVDPRQRMISLLVLWCDLPVGSYSVRVPDGVDGDPVDLALDYLVGLAERGGVEIPSLAAEAR